MGRKVFITGDMSVDERLITVAEQDPLAALLWPWFLTVFDDWGRAEANPRRLKAQVFPINNLVTIDLIETALKLYAQEGLLQIYEANGKPYMAIPQNKWYKYQTHMRRERRPGKDKMASNFPAPPEPQPHGDARGCVGNNGDMRVPVPSPSPSPSPSSKKKICAPDGALDGAIAQSQDQPGEQREWAKTPDMSSPGSVEAETVTATGENRPRLPFRSKKQEQLFDQFWPAYPKKRSKGQAEKAWAKINPSEQLFEAIMCGLKRAKTSEDWRREGGQYIPYPATWLNAKGWEDEYGDNVPRVIGPPARVVADKKTMEQLARLEQLEARKRERQKQAEAAGDIGPAP